MRVDLAVPFDEKDQARGLGAKWDPARRVWFVQNQENLQPFLRWMSERLKRPHDLAVKKRYPSAPSPDRT
jgi:hypothetical protein